VSETAQWFDGRGRDQSQSPHPPGVGVGVADALEQLETQVCAAFKHVRSAVASVWLHGSTHAIAVCIAAVHALEVGSLHACSAAVISDLQSLKHACSAVFAAKLHVCSVDRHPLTHWALVETGVVTGVATAHAP